MEKIYNELIKYLSKDRVLKNEPMCKHTSFKIGGPADIFVKVNTIEELKNTLNIAKTNKIPVTCIGNGTNLLVKDKGIRGITIKLDFKDINVNGEEIEVGSGMQLPILAKTAYSKALWCHLPRLHWYMGQNTWIYPFSWFWKSKFWGTPPPQSP